MTSSFLKQATEGNKNAILKQQIIRQYIFSGDSSITDLSRAVNLSVPTVTKLIGELIEEGFVHNFGEQGTAGGRRPNIYGLNPYAGYFVGVEIRNDTRAATYGEYMYGDAHSEKTMLYINASWGLGLGMILDGKVFYGKSGFSGEFGHFPLLDNEIICRCGKRGCLETGASGSALHRLFLEKLRSGSVSMLSEKFNKGEEITLKDILDAVLKEDVLAIEILESVGHTLGKAIAGLINMFNPEMIVIGGLLSVAGESLMLPVRTAVNKYSLMLVYKDTQIKFSTLGERAGVIGACLLARSKALGFY